MAASAKSAEKRSNGSSPAEILADSGNASNEKLERIRDIVFGSQIREYSQQFELIQNDIVRLQQEVQHLSEKLSEKESLLTQQLRERDEKLMARIQEQGEQQRAEQRDLDSRQSQRIEALEDKQRQDYAEIQQKTQRHENEIRDELRQSSQRLVQDKMDRVSLGDLLVELGTSLKKGDSSHLMTDLLSELSDSLNE